jgi:hypothetical protein
MAFSSLIFFSEISRYPDLIEGPAIYILAALLGPLIYSVMFGRTILNSEIPPRDLS